MTADAPHVTAPRRDAQAARQRRLAAALRENLRRRKAQAQAQNREPSGVDALVLRDARGLRNPEQE